MLYSVDNPGSRSRTRTYDRAINSRLLYQLSYQGPAGGAGIANAAAERNCGLPGGNPYNGLPGAAGLGTTRCARVWWNW